MNLLKRLRQCFPLIRKIESHTVKAAFNPSTRITGSRVSCPSRHLRPSRNEFREYSEDLLGWFADRPSVDSLHIMPISCICSSSYHRDRRSICGQRMATYSGWAQSCRWRIKKNSCIISDSETQMVPRLDRAEKLSQHPKKYLNHLPTILKSLPPVRKF